MMDGKKVKRWLWAYKTSLNEKTWLVTDEFLSEEEVGGDMTDGYITITELKKIPWSEMEFDE